DPPQRAGTGAERGPHGPVRSPGGARGITAQVALELARRYKPRLVLVGSSPEPVAEPADTAGLTAAAELKAALMKRLQAAPAVVEAAYRPPPKDPEERAAPPPVRGTRGAARY